MKNLSSRLERVVVGLLLMLCPWIVFAGVDIVSLLPNPAGDDTVGEYIEIRNTGCQSIDIGGYHLYDAANKIYVIPTGTSIASQSNLSFPYAETKIALNNSGFETITLTSTTGAIIDTESYSGTQRDNVIIYLTTTDEDCSILPPVDNSTSTTNTGTTDIGSQIDSSLVDTNTGVASIGSGVVDTSGGQGSGTTDIGTTNTGNLDNTGATNTGTTDTGMTSTGVTIDTGVSNSGTSNTGTTSSGSGAADTSGGQSIDTTSTGVMNTGATSSGLTSSGIIFPDIISTRQEPTNAIFTGGVWDCGSHQPCRVNVTFDPIFTGSFLARNYICEVITATGTMTTCNPNTLYFSTGSLFGFRLTSKIDPTQSRSVSWEVSFYSTPNPSLIAEGSGITGTGSQNPIDSPLTGGIDVTNTGITSSGSVFPDIIPTWQNYTNTTHSGDILACVTSPCRVNFTLEPIFTGGISARDYTCQITYGTGVYDSCNPPQLYPIGTGSIQVILTHRASGQNETKTLEIIQNIGVPAISTPGIITLPATLDTNPPVAILEFDGKIQSYYEQIGDYEFNCYTMTCSVNLSADRSYDPEGGKIRYLWYYGANDIKTTRDPGGRKYGTGDHEIWLRLIDMSGNMSEIRYRIHVLGPRDQGEKIKTKKVKDPSLRATKQSSATKTKKKKPNKMDFFDPPTISLQNSKFIEIANGYICRTKTKTCSLNLTLSGAEKGILYTWTYDDGDTLISKNPKSKNLSIGSHTIIVSAAYSGSTDVLWTQTISARVDRIITPKKPKKVKVPKVTTKKLIQENPILAPAHEQTPEDDIPYTTVALFGGILPLILLRRFFTG